MYSASDSRYSKMKYQYCGQSGLLLPRISLGLWHNFGSSDNYENMKEMLFTAFDNGITYFDLANNYGPVYGSAESNFGKIMKEELSSYRDQIIIATKAGYDMWPGPYGNYGSRKYLMASLDQSLERMGLKYVDIFYHHRPDPNTPMEETMRALADIVAQGKALYVGVSNYNAQQTMQAATILKSYGVPLLVNQYRYHMFQRDSEEDKLPQTLTDLGAGAVVFSPLAQGLLSNKYLQGIPTDSRAAKNQRMKEMYLTAAKLQAVKELNEIAASRNQSLAQMALAWDLRQNKVTSVIIGASKPRQIIDNIGALNNLDFSDNELKLIDEILLKEKND